METQSTKTYANEEFGFSLTVPPTWIDSYQVKGVAKNEDGYKALVFTEKRYHYPLLQIALIPESQWGSYEKTMYEPLGQMDGMIYGSLLPPETLFITNEKGEKQEISYVTEMIGDIKDSLDNKQYKICNKGS